jgi:hypothetical protein
MSEITRISLDLARFEPGRAFGTPDKLLACIALTRGQKIAALERWWMQIQEQLKASGEGMPANQWTEIDLELLEQIKAALERLKDTEKGT